MIILNILIHKRSYFIDRQSQTQISEFGQSVNDDHHVLQIISTQIKTRTTNLTARTNSLAKVKDCNFKFIDRRFLIGLGVISNQIMLT